MYNFPVHFPCINTAVMYQHMPWHAGIQRYDESLKNSGKTRLVIFVLTLSESDITKIKLRKKTQAHLNGSFITWGKDLELWPQKSYINKRVPSNTYSSVIWASLLLLLLKNNWHIISLTPHIGTVNSLIKCQLVL